MLHYQRIVIAVSSSKKFAVSDRLQHNCEHISFGKDDGTTAYLALTPRDPQLRFSLASDADVTVLPGFHDPTPLSDAHRAILGTHAAAGDTMRHAMLKMHNDCPIPEFHPDV